MTAPPEAPRRFAGWRMVRVAFLVDGCIALIDAPRDLKVRYGERRVRVEQSEINGTSSQRISH